MINHAEAERDYMLPPGFGFHPTDEVIISCYLTRKALDPLFNAVVMGEVNLNNWEPWDLPAMARIGEREWYFFWHKDCKYPTGTRTNYATESGYWKATGDKEIFVGRGVVAGMKKTLVFYLGRVPRGEKTGWVMHEYRLLERKMPHPPPRSDKEWVVCKVFNMAAMDDAEVQAESSSANRNERPSTLETMESDNFGADLLVSVLRDGSSTPQKLPLECLRRITNGFSDERLLGEGGFGKVYKGVLPDGQMVAVKKLNQFKPGVHDKQFENEVRHLIKLTHPNIVRLVGYCYETQNQYMTYDEKGIFAEIQERLLCLEFLSNGSLDNHISDECSGLDWHTRYKIIHGICFGVHYLHEECQSEINATIVHLDLKPANILLGYDMVPKIADFGLSKLFCDTKTQTYATSLMGSHGYMAPEYILDNKITTAADMYSLGIIIIEIITGSKVHFSLESSRQDIVDFIESALKKWTSRQEASEPCENLENHYHQIKFCLEIGIRCIEFDPMKRPNIRDVYNEFNKWLSIKPEVNGCTACRES